MTRSVHTVDQENLSATLTIAVPAAGVFAVLADPTTLRRHRLGSGSCRPGGADRYSLMDLVLTGRDWRGAWLSTAALARMSTRDDRGMTTDRQTGLAGRH